MKKRLAALLLTGVMAFSAGAWINVPQENENAAEETVIENTVPGKSDYSMDEIKAIIHEMYVANQRVTILENHSSVAYKFVNAFPAYVNYSDYYYITSEMEYMASSDWTELKKERMIYCVSGLTDPENIEYYYKFDLRKDDQQYLFNYAPDDETEWQDYEHGTPAGAFLENGLLRIVTVYDAEFSKAYAKQVGFEYNGQVYSNETIVNPVTYEIYADYMYGTLGEDKTMVSAIFVGYDVAEPRECAMMRTAFERKAEKYMKVTFVADPDTVDEISYSAILPVNNEVKFLTDDLDTVRVFDDRECTVLTTTHWDRSSDRIYYLKHVE